MLIDIKTLKYQNDTKSPQKWAFCFQSVTSPHLSRIPSESTTLREILLGL